MYCQVSADSGNVEADAARTDEKCWLILEE